jgi:NAD(P)H-quinone oxidoreductase subunit 5
MDPGDDRQKVGALTSPVSSPPHIFARLATWGVWMFCAASLGGLVLRFGPGPIPAVEQLATFDGLTLLLWSVVGFIGGIVHSYALNYMTGDSRFGWFFAHLFAFIVAVSVLVAADHIVLFGFAWGAMGLMMSRLIGHHRSWADARSAGRYAGMYFGLGTVFVSVGLGVAAHGTGAMTISGIGQNVAALSTTHLWIASGAIVAAAMVQSALFPFHAWLLGSMTAPTPASALMHAGFVNAGGVLVARLAPMLSTASIVMAVLLLVGAVSALGGKVLKSVQIDIKGKFGCSTVGQMGFMLMQAGLGYFGAAITHLVLHGFYKAYMFLSSGARVEAEAPISDAEKGGAGGVVAGVVLAVAGGVLFAWLTGKGTKLNSGLILTILVTLTTYRAVRAALNADGLPTSVRYGAMTAVFLPTIAIYAGAYNLVSMILAGVPAITAPTPLGPLHVVVVVAFFAAYLVIESGVYKQSTRLYGMLRGVTRPPSKTLLNS